MSLTYRAIGARAKIQGGSVFNNLAITNQLSSRPPVITSGNVPLVEIVVAAIENSTVLIQSILTSLQSDILNQAVNYKNLADFVTSAISTTLSLDDTPAGFLAQLYDLLLTRFTTSIPPLFINNVNFMSRTSEALVPFAESIIFNENLDSYIIDDLVTNLPNNKSLLQTLSQKVASYLFQDTEINNAITNLMPAVPLYFTLVWLTDRTTTILTKLFISPNDTRTIRFNMSQFDVSEFTDALTLLRFTLHDANDTLVHTFYDESFSPPVPQISTTVSEVTLSNTTSTARLLYIKVYIEFTVPYVTLSGSCNFLVTRASLTEENVIDTSFVPPKIFLRLIQNNVGYYVYDNFKKRVQRLLTPKNGMIQFTNGYPLWNVSLQNMLTSFVCQGTDYSMYVTGNVNGTITLNSTVPIINPYTSGDLVVLIKYNVAGIAQWICNIKSLGLSNHSVQGIVSDVSDNVYIYGTHNGSALYAYNNNNTGGTIIDTGPYGSDKNHAFIAKYTSAGVLSGFVNISNTDTSVSITSVFVDSDTNGVCISGCAKSFSPTVIRNFNDVNLSINAKANIALTQPIGYGFSVYINNVNQFTIVEKGTYSVIHKLNPANNSLDYDFLGNV